MNNKRFLVCMVFVSFALTGCATVYLHNEADAKAMADAKEGLQAARTAHLAVFDDHEKYLASAFKAEREALTSLELARRDLEVAAVLNTTRQPNSDGLQALKHELYIPRLEAIDPELAKGLSGDAPVDQHLLERLNAVSLQEQSVTKFERNFADDVAAFERSSGGGKGPVCTQGKLNPEQPHPGTPQDAQAIFASLKSICESLEDARARLDKRRFITGDPNRQVPAWVAVMAGNSSRVNELSSRGELQQTARQAAELRELSEAQDVLAANADRHRRALEQYLKCLQDQAQGPDLAGEIKNATEQLRAFIGWLAELNENALQNTPPESPKPVPQQCKLSSGETIARPPQVRTLRDLAALSETGTNASSLTRIQELLATLSAFKPTRSLVASLRETAQSIRERQLYKILDAIAKSSDGTAPTDRAAKIAVSSIQLVSLIRDLDPDRLPKTSAVLIDLADARMKASNARVEAERLKKLAELADLRFIALRNEVLILQTGVDQVARGRTKPFDTLLRAYNESWMRGRLQQSLLEHDMLNLEYTAWVERQRIATEATYAILDPAFAELGAYADGGFKPEDIARYLGVLGIGAIAVGTN